MSKVKTEFTIGQLVCIRTEMEKNKYSYSPAKLINPNQVERYILNNNILTPNGIIYVDQDNIFPINTYIESLKEKQIKLQQNMDKINKSIEYFSNHK